MTLPTLRQLQYFLAVMELRHFGLAAEQCCVSQSTLSAGIQELESMLGVQLFERSHRKISPTESALAMAEKAEQILSLSEAMVDEVQDKGLAMTGNLRLGVIPTIGPFLLPRVLPEIRNRYPDLKLQLIEDQTANLLKRMNEGSLDAIILALPFDIGKLEKKVFWSENFMVAVPANHSMAKLESINSLKLPAEELLLLEEGHCFSEHVLEACRMKGMGKNSAFQGTSLYTLIQMVASGQGVTFIPEMAINSVLIKVENIQFRPLSEPGPHREIGLAWRPSYPKKEDLLLLGNTFNEFLSAD